MIDYDRHMRRIVANLGRPVIIKSGGSEYNVDAVIELDPADDPYSDAKVRRRFKQLEIRVVKSTIAAITLVPGDLVEIDGIDHEVYAQPEDNRFEMITIRLRNA